MHEEKSYNYSQQYLKIINACLHILTSSFYKIRQVNHAQRIS
jgi:hypothetical protein